MAVTVRTVSFTYEESFAPAWHPRLPEFACAANAVSLMMPYAEPYIAKAVRGVVPELESELAAEAKNYVGQELQHHVQHRRLNELLRQEYPGVTRVERVMRWVFAQLEHRGTPDFNLAFAAGFEALAYTGARWTEQQLGRLFDGSEPVAASLFLWHLAEEVEHKSVAHDVFNAVNGKRLTYLAGMLTSTLLLVVFTWWSTLVMLRAQGLLFHPRAHVRLATWSIGFAFELLPALAISVLRSHHPDNLVDPPWFAQWLRSYDPATGHLPLWNQPTVSSPSRLEEQ